MGEFLPQGLSSNVSLEDLGDPPGAGLEPNCGEQVPKGTQPVGEFRPQGLNFPWKKAQPDKDVEHVRAKCSERGF